ncbi:probable serine/threonine-protein kinase PBL9 [Hordeum vulgare subsp. vulgare]|uniref:Protein kinase domain-containing protein n=1 Tax=Hordeum vulgare subsp. vulgare TaxID=112509 RepID=A0A287GLI6_HORVV|nr:probable serine/threonine-protein kinase PBL9 [Hordeum vulgare subsp. vulgare]
MEQKVEIPESKLKDYIQDTDKTKWRLKNNHNIKYFSEDEIKRITSNYSTKLGNGAFGEVYKGVLDDDQWVAVKKYIRLDSQEEFAKEVIIHSQINHKNVIRLVGCCIDENAQTMVLEHASNGNLSDRLHCHDNPISLATRLNIAIECAEALGCMHSMYNPVIHLDIKPSNILLGDDFHAKISDFGISRLRDNIESAINVIGCIGYMDPAFRQEGCLITVKSDVYSFGVVLVELITKTKPTDETKRVIQRFGKAFTKGRPVRDLFDADIANKSNTKVLEAIGAIANKCLNEEYDARPEMNDVAGRLRDLRAVLESGQGKSQTGWRFFNGGQNELKTEKPGVAWSSIFSRNTTIFKKGYPAPAGIPRYSYGDLKMMTKNFIDVLGRGAYCTVYRGHLPDGRAVAVKQLYGVGGSEVEFWSEVTIMARMNHRNIVSIWGWCADKGQRMLILEFISNGSLDKHVLPASTQEDDGPGQRQHLDLNTRHQIALGVAHAMAYMHEECSDGVLHCDIKPHNILLDDNFCPKLTDFGLSTWLSKTMSRVRGTRGYMAPEWVIHREVITAKADVYSFGMVLLEVVSGRNYNFREESVGSEDWYFPKWVYEKCYIHHKIEDILDPILQAEACQGTGIAELMVNTAIWCLQDRAEKRPSMGKVVKMLDGTIEMTKQPEKPVIFCACDD